MVIERYQVFDDRRTSIGVRNMSTDVIQDLVSVETTRQPGAISIETTRPPADLSSGATRAPEARSPEEDSTETRGAPGEPLPHPSVEEIQLAAVLHALSDPMRLQIVTGLAGGASRTCKSFELPVTKSTCTHHFKVLREAGVIHQRQEGTARLNTLRRDDLEARFPGVLDTILQAAGETPPRQLV